jgi:hypothetical protein
MGKSVTIRVWDGSTVKAVFTVGATGSSWIGNPGGAENSTKVDIELDPWAGLVVDHRREWPAPVGIATGETD